MLEQVDPVLLQLQRWAVQRGLTREAVAQRLGVSRAAVAGWFIGLEAQQAGRGVPRSARGFRYGAQRASVQLAIAEVLGSSRESLQAESLAVIATAASPSRGGMPATVGEIEQAALSVIDELGMGPGQRPVLSDVVMSEDVMTSIVQTVQSHPGVSAVLALKERRGPLEAFQHQVAVLCPSHLHDDDSARRQLRDEITASLQAVGLPSKWEHGSLVPQLSLVDSDGDRLHLLGSVIAPKMLAPRAPRSGLLVPQAARPGSPGEQLRIAAVIGDPYTGNDVAAAALAQVLGAGFVSTDQLRRAVAQRRVRSQGGPELSRAQRLDAVTESDASFVLHKSFHVLAAGRVPGAWVVPIPVRQFMWYEPLHNELVDVGGLVVAMRLGPAWRRFAAWRLAAIDLNSARLAAEDTDVVSSDQLDLRDGDPITADARRVLDEHHQRALVWIRELEVRDEFLTGFVQARAERQGADVLTVTLDELPAELNFLDVGADVARAPGRAGQIPEVCLFPDDMNSAVSVWLDLVPEVLEHLRTRAGLDVEEFTAGLHPGVVADNYRLLER